MILLKTPAGQEAMKDRHGGLTPRQRSAFILFDGKRTLAEVLAATAGMGITQADVERMIEQGLLQMPVGRSEPAAAAAAAAEDAGGSGRSSQERYQAAYPIATELTAALGLRGFRLNLAVEGATSYDDLAALAPKIRDAVGADRYTRLERALFS